MLVIENRPEWQEEDFDRVLIDSMWWEREKAHHRELGNESSDYSNSEVASRRLRLRSAAGLRRLSDTFIRDAAAQTTISDLGPNHNALDHCQDVGQYTAETVTTQMCRSLGSSKESESILAHPQGTIVKILKEADKTPALPPKGQPPIQIKVTASSDPATIAGAVKGGVGAGATVTSVLYQRKQSKREDQAIELTTSETSLDRRSLELDGREKELRERESELLQTDTNSLERSTKSMERDIESMKREKVVEERERRCSNEYAKPCRACQYYEFRSWDERVANLRGVQGLQRLREWFESEEPREKMHIISASDFKRCQSGWIYEALKLRTPKLNQSTQTETSLELRLANLQSEIAALEPDPLQDCRDVEQLKRLLTNQKRRAVEQSRRIGRLERFIDQQKLDFRRWFDQDGNGYELPPGVGDNL